MSNDGDKDDRSTPGSLPQERVEDRDNVGTTTPDAYPEADRQNSRVDGDPKEQ